MKTTSAPLVAAIATCISASAFAQSADLPARSADNTRAIGKSKKAGIEEVVVTAQKREERLQDVPISISVLRGDDLDRSTDRGTAEALNRVPGAISYVANATARTGNTGGAVVVRGVSPSQSVGTGTTAYYLDSIPFGFVRNIWVPDSNPYDLDRIEVLRGPQGTLYGMNALNGVVRVLTKNADLNRFELKGRALASSTEHGAESYAGDLAINVPIIEGKLAARAVLGYKELGGWIDKSFEKDANDSQIASYRLKINAQPTEDFSLALMAWRSRTESGAPPSSADGRTSVSQAAEPSSVDYDAYSLQLHYDFAGFSITGMTSYIDFENRLSFDFTPFVPAVPNNLNSVYGSEIFSQEVVINSSQRGPWRWSLGGIYRDAEDPTRSTRNDPFTGELVAPYQAPSLATYYSESFAVFGEITRALLDGRFEVTGGLRYFEDKVRDQERSRLNFPGGLPPTGLIDAQNTFDKVSPRVVLTWHPGSQATVYASYAEGFRSGVGQLPLIVSLAPDFPPAEPDTLKNYELGVKGSVWDGRLSFDAATYYIDWEDPQQSGTAAVLPGVLLPVAASFGNFSGVGFDFGTTVQPADRLTLGFNFSWNDLKTDANQLVGAAGFIPKGSRLGASPEYSVGGSMDWTMFRRGNGWSGRFYTAANYTPEIIVGRTLQSATTPYTTTTQDAFWMVNSRFAVDAPGGWTASLFVDNLTNDEAFSADGFSPRWNTRLRPRTVGLQFEYRY